VPVFKQLAANLAGQTLDFHLISPDKHPDNSLQTCLSRPSLQDFKWGEKFL
jgi:hypothetical protein